MSPSLSLREGAAGISSPSCDWTRTKNKLRSPSASDSPSSEVESNPFNLDGEKGITSPSLVVKDMNTSSCPFLHYLLPISWSIPAQMDNNKRSQGLDARAKGETGVPGNKKSRTWLVRIRQEIPSRRPLVDQSVASAANCLFSVSIGGATTIMSSTPTRAGGFETLVLHRRHAHQRHSSFPDIARGAEEPEERRLRQLRPEPSCRRVTTSLPDRESPGFSPDHSRLSSPPA